MRKKKIELALDALTAYTASLANRRRPPKSHGGPTKIEESRQRALSSYHLVVVSLPSHSS